DDSSRLQPGAVLGGDHGQARTGLKKVNERVLALGILVDKDEHRCAEALRQSLEDRRDRLEHSGERHRRDNLQLLIRRAKHFNHPATAYSSAGHATAAGASTKLGQVGTAIRVLLRFERESQAAIKSPGGPRSVWSPREGQGS